MRPALAFVLCALGGCAVFPLSEADCRPASWRERGYADGFSGAPAQDLRLARECGRLGIAIAQDDYLGGWRAGHDEWDRLIGSMDRKR